MKPINFAEARRVFHPLGGATVLLAHLIATPCEAEPAVIPIETHSHVLVLQTDEAGRLYSAFMGKKLDNQTEYARIAPQYRYADVNAGMHNSAYTPAGTWNLSEPAMAVEHADGNRSLELIYRSHQTETALQGSILTRILLADPNYPFEVSLCYRTWPQLDVVEQWVEIVHEEPGAVILNKYASANLYFSGKEFYLTTFHNQWAKEMQPAETRLERGIRSIDSKLGARAMLWQSPCFILSLDGAAREDHGRVLLGQLAWSGNFRSDFEVDPYGNLRLISGINPHESSYTLPPGSLFKTPSFIYALSSDGIGGAGRHLHRWAKKHRIHDGEGERLTLLNNWEATSFSFDQERIASLFEGARELGVDLFLLDDGWFANKYPRNDSRAGLGDWEENRAKLPDGIGYLVKQAHENQIRFGIWIEPEMVNPKSELYEKHPDWVIRQPDRPEKYFRNQLVLDLANPDVQDFCYGVVDKLLSENPELAFIKWDCNAVIYNSYSPYLARNSIPQTHLYVDYVQGLYSVLKRIRDKYPAIPMMLCSGGGGRGDYEILKYFTEFWPSDNTDPHERVYMQWNYSCFYPAIATDNHVTQWSDAPIKFKVDVASMGKLGFDIDVAALNKEEFRFCREAVANYNRFRKTVWNGDLYRLVDPHGNDMASLMYVSEGKGRAVVFTYLVNQRYRRNMSAEPIRLKGLDPARLYRVTEINLYPGTHAAIDQGAVYSGEFLMSVGINPHISRQRSSVVLEIEEK